MYILCRVFWGGLYIHIDNMYMIPVFIFGWSRRVVPPGGTRRYFFVFVKLLMLAAEFCRFLYVDTSHRVSLF